MSTDVRARRRPRMRSLVATIMAFTLVVVGLTLANPEPAEAVVVQWGRDGGTAPNYQANVNGDFLMAGNGVLACTATTGTANGTCSELHSTSSNTENVNDNFIMSNVNAVSGFTTNSSSATVNVPAGATVVKAFLTWSANTGVYTGDSRYLCSQYSTSRGTATMPAGSATGYTSRAVQLRVGSGAIANVAPQSVLVDPTSQATARYYSASADVTSAFSGVATGSNVTISAGNIWTPTGAGCYAGWSVTVVYDYGAYIADNPASAPHNVIFYEGHVRQGANDSPLTVAFNGFTAVAPGTRAGFTLFEGDRSITGDTASYARGTSTTYAVIPNADGITNNIGIGRAANSVRYTGSGTPFTNQSVDVTVASLYNVSAGDSRVNLRLATTGDSYLLRNAVLSVPTAGLQVSKSFDGTADAQSRVAGEAATFTIRVTNTGAGSLRNIVVEDDQADCSRALTGVTLAPSESTTFTCTGAAPTTEGYVSTAEATAYTSLGNYLAQDSDTTTVRLSAITLEKTSALAPGATGRAGDVLTYTFTVRNTGESTLSGIVIRDPLPGLSPIVFGSWPGQSGVLQPGQSVTATATYTLTQSDVDAGSIANSAVVTASDEDGGLQPSGNANRVTPIAAAGAIGVSKTGTLASGATGRVGDRIDYVFTFTNTGNVTLDNASLVDPLPGLSPPVVTWPTATAGRLPVGATARATASYTITQADVDAGFVRNTATATGRTPTGATVSGRSPQVQVATIASAPGLTTTKSGSITSGTGGVGSTITYTFTLRNSGNTTLTAVGLADPLPGLSALSYTWPGTAGRLAPGQSVTATATYTITQADVDAGAVRNTATGTATTPAGAVLSVPSSQSTVVTAPSAPAVTLTKTGALRPGSAGSAGDVVDYTFTIRNSGNVTLSGAAITDPLPGLTALAYTWPGAAGVLAPGQTATATASYTLTQRDVDAGSVVNSATVTARPPAGVAVTQTRSATVPISPSGTLTVLKSGALTAGDGSVGSTVTYRFSVTNAGNVTLSQVAIADALPGLSAIAYTWPGTARTLAPGQTAQGTATYTIRQADVDAGAVTNTATASGRTPAGATVTGASSAVRVATIAAAPATATTKAASVSGTGSVGDVITYTVRTTNSGNVTLDAVRVTDALPGLSSFTYTWPGAAGRLAPGQSVTAVASYTITQADVDAGAVRNTASSTATFGATTVTSTSGAVVTETAAAAPALVTTKSGALQSGSSGRAGDTITWSITLRNAGNVTLTAVSVADSLPGITPPSCGTWPDGTAGVLRPGQTVTATATSVITQLDVDSGAVANTATGTGQPPAGGAVSSVAPATVSLASAPGLTLAKTGAVSAGNGGVGSTVTYSFTARNTGNVTLTGVAIQDQHAGLSAIAYTWPGAVGALSPGQTLTATATYRVSQADVDAGVVRNTATISGRPPTGPAITATAQASVPTIAAAPAITTSKTAAGAGARVGETVTYTFRASNSGNVTLTDVAITDPLPRLGAIEYSWPGTPGTLAPGQTVTATAGYTVTQADVDAGSITNTSTATGTAGGATVTARSGAVITSTAASAPALAVSKTGTLDGAGVSGDTISYAFTVRNAGNVTLNGVSLTDPLIGATPIALSGWAGAPGTLAPGESVSGVATYTLTQGDVDAGAVANIATASGTPVRGASVTGTAPATVPIAPSPQIAVSKTGAVTSGDSTAGSVITFSFAIRNAGNVTLSAVSLSDSLAGLSAPTISWPGAANVLAPGQSATGTATYTVRQSDVDAGEVRNTASASGRPPTGPVVSATSGTAVVPTAAAAPALTVTKSASPAGGRVGEAISYSIRVQNSGNQTLTAVSIADQLPGLSPLAVTWPGTPGTLAPGQAATARATYTITQSDVNAGAVQNRASAAGTAPGGVPVSAQSPLVTTPTVTAAAGVSFTKTAALAPGATGRAGDAVTYTFTIGNSGNVTLTDVAVDDRLPGLSVPSYAWPGTAGVLQPGQSVIATATRTLTQADVDAGSVANTATATATPPSGPAVERMASATLPLAPGPALTITKSGAYTSGTGAVGSVVGYTFTARNTGNVTLTAVAVTDGLAGLSPIALTWPGTPGMLAPGAAVTGTATYTVTQADVDAGRIINSARVSGTPPSGAAVGATSAPVVLATAAAGPALTTTKIATVSGIRGVGDVVTYTLSATNSGNVTLRAVSISDPLPGLSPLVYAWPGEAGVLAPGQRVTATTSHTITQADVDAGSLVNTATSTGTAPNGTVVSAASPTVTTPTVPAAPQLQVEKSGALPDGAKGVADEVITWTVTLRNTGNVTLSGVSARDSLPGISDLVYGPWPGGSEGTLAPGASVTATATSIVRQSDVDAGAVSNTATATGAPSRGQPATGIGSATVTLAADPGLSIGKSGAYTTGTGAVGDEITYSYAVQNTGNVTLTGVTINDPHSGLSTISYGAWPTTAGTLAPGQTVSATATYVVRQSDVNTGSITDTATVSGRTPAGAAVAATSPTVVLQTNAAAPALLTTKTATVGGTGAVGDLVTYTLRAANSGNVTLTGVRITDPAPGLSPIIYGSWPSAVGTLQPGQSVSATTTHRITQADLDAGSIRNTATSTGTPPSGPAVSDPSDEVTVATAAQRPDIEVTKSGVLARGATGAVGDTVNFSFTLRNSGNVTLTGVALDERLAGVSDPVYSWPAAPGTLAPGQTVTATATYGLTQADVDAGSVVNTVVGGASFGGASVTKDASATVPLGELVSPAVSVSTDGVLSGDPKAGSTVTWTYTLTNTGNVTLTAAGVTDALPGVTAPQYGPWPATPGTLAPGESVTATATSVLTQADVDAGAIVSVVTGAGRSPGGTTVNATASDTVPVIAGAAITLDKSADDVAGLTAGQIIEFTFEVQNTGQLTLDGVTLTDLLPGLSQIVFGAWPSGTPGTLAPGDTVIATATYRVTQADVDRGYIDNSSTATGHPARGESVQSTDTVVLTTATPAPAIVLDKTTAASGFRLGDTIGYEFVVENTGNVTLSSVELSDQLSGLSAISFGAWPTAERGVLPPASRVRATAQYTVTQADVDRGELSNTATASATSPQGAAVSDDDTASTTAAAAAPAIVVTKAGALAAGSTGRAGDVAEYRFTATNTGTVTLTDVTFTDQLAGLSPITVTWPGGTGVLAPGQQATATATYVLRQSDVDAGAVANTVVASAQPPLGAPRVEGTAGATVPIAPGAALTAVKTGVIADGGIGQVNDVIQYEIVATNTGNVTIRNGGLVDAKPGLYDVQIAWADPAQPGRLDVGDSVVGRGKYRITQADVDRGYVDNIGTVGGDPPSGPRVTARTNQVVINTVQPAPGIAVTKTGTATGDGGVGDAIRYTFEIRNTGNVTLSAVALEDALPGVQLSAITWPTATAGVIAPGQAATATGTYEITQGDVDLGRVLNTATATGTPARATEPVSATSPQSLVETAAARPALTVTDRGALAPDATGRAGDVVTWSYSLTNSGNVTLSGVALADALPGVSGPQYEWNTPTGVLAPNESVTATATYRLTQADVDAGSVTSLVTGTGTPVVGAPVSTAQAATVAITPDPGLVVTKSGAPSGGEVASVITYSFTVANDGNVTLSGVELTDDLRGLGPIDISWPAVPGVLAPGQTATGTARYAVTQADVDAGQVVNRASATATPPGAAPFTARSNEVTIATVEAAPGLVTSKSAVVGGSGAVGDTISYTITAQNSGNVTLTGVTITDELEGLSRLRSTWPAAQGVLAPNETVTATATYTITQADVDRGEVVNTASSAGITPAGGTVDDAAAPLVVTTAAAAPSMDVVKTGALEAGATGEVGDVVDFAVRVENTGNVTLTAIAIDDQLPGISDLDVAWPGPAAVLEPGEIATATATYALTQADIDAGKIDNEVVVGAVAARGGSVSGSDAVSVVVPRSPALSAVKSGVLTGGGIGQVGDVIQYEVTVTNSGNVTVTNGSLVDPMTGLYDVSIVWPDAGAPGRVGVGQQAVGQGKYRLTQADVDRGFVENTATVGADAPGGVRVEEDTNTVVINTVLPAGALRVDKRGIVAGDGGVGSPIEYEFTISNTGNVTLNGIELSDQLRGLSAPVIRWPATPGTLAPGQAATATARYTITQADLDAGAVVNTATATGTGRGGAVTSAPTTATVPTQQIQASIEVAKTAALAPGSTGVAGDIVNWGYTLRNTSNVTLTGVALTDRMAGSTAPAYDWPGTPGVLLPGETVTATAQYALTQSDVDRGVVSSAVDGRAVPPRGAEVTGSATASVTIDARPALVATKAGALDGDGNVGDGIRYDFTIANRGNVTLTLVDLVDALPGVSRPVIRWPGEPGVLAPGQQVTATAGYTITQEDVDLGQVTNTATASGKPPVGDTIFTTTPPSVTAVAAAAPQLRVTKDAALDGDGSVGDIVTYAFTIENAGNVSLRGIQLVDDLAGLSAPIVRWPGLAGELAPGQQATATATYAVTQADVDRGEIVNTAGATGTAPGGAAVTSAPVVARTTVAEAAPAIAVEKSGALEAGGTGEVGEVVRFDFTVRNDGNQTLSDVQLTDALPGLGEIEMAWPNPDPAAAGILPVGASATGTASYALTQADVDAGAVVNAVVVGAVAARGGSVSGSDAVSVVVPRSPALSAVKSGVLTGGGIGQVGDVIQYEVTVTNSGNVTVTNGSLVDPMTGLYDVSIVWPDAGAPGRVGVGQQAVGQGKYRLTQADVDRGFVENTATVAADAPGGVRVEEDTNTVVINTVLPAGALAVTKTGALTGDGGVGDEIEYAFEVANTGNVTLSGITLTDELPGVTAPEVVWPGADGVLAPGQTATATARYTITQADLDAGNVRNVAEARGRTPGGALIEAESLPNVVATQDAEPAVRVDDRGALAPGATGRPGEVVVWSYTLTNTGNVTLSSASVSEALPGAGAPEYRWPGTPGVLLPGDSVTATVRYTLTQADVDAGAVTSVVTGTGTPAVGAAATATASATVRIEPETGLTFAKTAALADPQRNGLGDAVTFGFRIQNSGNVTLSEIAITDQLAGIGPIEFAWPDRAGVLAPGQVATATATYRIAQEDVDRGQIENTASVRGQTPAGGTVTAASTIEPIPTVDADPSISVDKSGAYISGDGEIGSVIRYTFEIRNTGNVTLNQVRLQDELAGLSTPEIQFPAATGILAPGVTAVGTATYTLTQADIDAGSVTNLASVSGTSPNGDVVSGVSERVTIDTEPPTAPVSAVETTQSARLAAGAAGVLGDTVEYSFRIRNIGNTTLYDVTLQNTITDLQGFTYAWPDPANPGRLLPGQSVSIKAFRLVTQADVDAGEIRNIAVGSGERPRGDEVADASPATVVRLPSGTGGLAVSKSGTLLGDGTAGSLIDYAFTVTNTGTLTLDDVELSDPLSGLGAIRYGTWPGEVGVLAPGQSVSATAQYAIRQADVDEGAVRNTASANAVLPDGDPITADSPESVVRTAAAAPHIDIEKTARLADDATGRPGDTVVYVFTIANDGNITLRDVSVGDSQPGLSNIRITWPGAAGVLAPGAVATGTAEYRLTQADVDAGGITSTARVDAVGAGVVVADEDTSVVEVAAAPALTLEKTAEVESVAQQGAAIIYTMTVSNTGNVTLRGVELTDELAGLSAPTAVWPQVPGVLGAGERAVFTARYVIGQADVDRGHIDNVAMAAATAPGGETLQATDAVTVPVPHHSAIDLVMSIAVADGQAGRAGDTLVFRYSATNTGTSTLTGVTITDPYPGLSDLTYEWPGAPGVLLPGQTVRAVATVEITPAMEGTVVSSRAVATAVGDGTDQVVDAADASVELPDPPGLLPDPGTLLPTTGGEVGLWWGISGLMLLSGLLLFAASRRRENRS